LSSATADDADTKDSRQLDDINDRFAPAVSTTSQLSAIFFSLVVWAVVATIVLLALATVVYRRWSRGRHSYNLDDDDDTGSSTSSAATASPERRGDDGRRHRTPSSTERRDCSIAFDAGDEQQRRRTDDDIRDLDDDADDRRQIVR